MLNLWVAGLALILLVTLAINGIVNRTWAEPAVLALGARLVLSPWIIGFTATVPLMWNSVIFGGFIFVLPVGVSLTIAAGGRRSHRAFSRRR